MSSRAVPDMTSRQRGVAASGFTFVLCAMRNYVCTLFPLEPRDLDADASGAPLCIIMAEADKAEHDPVAL